MSNMIACTKELGVWADNTLLQISVLPTGDADSIKRYGFSDLARYGAVRSLLSGLTDPKYIRTILGGLK